MNANLTIESDYQTVDSNCMPVSKIPIIKPQTAPLRESIAGLFQYYFPSYQSVFHCLTYLNSLAQDCQFVHDYFQQEWLFVFVSNYQCPRLFSLRLSSMLIH